MGGQVNEVPGSVPLTDEQRRVVTLPAEARAVVTAGAGTGKTLVLVGRLDQLVDVEDLDPGDELLVLSFSRAAVAEIRRRLRLRGGTARRVAVRTFDAFATAMLADSDPDGDWQRLGYDGRIARLAERLPAAGGELLDGLRHLLVDEIQDLVGVRAELVAALLEHLGGGFTLLGDPAQAIYDFQVRSEGRGPGSGEFFGWVSGRFPDLQRFVLSENFRARTAGCREVLRFGPDLVSGEDPEQVRRLLRSVILRLPALSGPENAARVLRRMRGPTAVLCRTNGAALHVSGALAEQGLAHRLQRPAGERALPPWLARAFCDAADPVLPRDRVLALLHAVLGAADPGPEAAWTLLKQAEGLRSRPGALDLVRLVGRLRLQVPDELAYVPAATVVVSTIHRAKGLEFDEIVLVEGGHDTGDGPTDEDNRLLYVALTRARDGISVLTPTGRLPFLGPPPDRRWLLAGPRPWLPAGMEVRSGDVDTAEPFPAGAGPDAVTAVQEHLGARVRPGDPVGLHRVPAPGTDVPDYRVVHDGVAVGRTTAAFGEALRRRLRGAAGRRGTWPETIGGLRVDCVQTVGPGGCVPGGGGVVPLWLTATVTGLGRVEDG